MNKGFTKEVENVWPQINQQQATREFICPEKISLAKWVWMGAKLS